MEKIVYARKENLGNDIFSVMVLLENGLLAQHNGPHNADFFTEEQADHLVHLVEESGKINTLYWTTEDMRDPYSDLRAMEDEFYSH